MVRHGTGSGHCEMVCYAGVPSLGYIYVQNHLPHGVLAMLRNYGSLTNNTMQLKGSESS